jgi:hypothetical protein
VTLPKGETENDRGLALAEKGKGQIFFREATQPRRLHQHATFSCEDLSILLANKRDK